MVAQHQQLVAIVEQITPQLASWRTDRQSETTVPVEWVCVGTHTGSLVLSDGTHLPPTGRRVSVPGMELVRVRDGRIAVENVYYDRVAVLTQLGLVTVGARPPHPRGRREQGPVLHNLATPR